ncbi:MAG TPA: hypothetical protein VJR89_09610 [Polyangiales bacterium]|nr:hypothetical protein [Polyangiales bacterium]
MKEILGYPCVLLLALAFAQPASAQAESSALTLACDVSGAGMNAEALRAAVERELTLPVRLVDAAAAQGPRLDVSASSSAAVTVRFVRDDGTSIERTVDVSSTGEHADETLALVAANLMRDEAASLLDALRAAQVAPVQPIAAAAPPPPPPPPIPHGCEPNGLRRLEVGLDVFPMVGMSSRDEDSVERTFSFNLFGGYTGAVRGFELGGFVNLDAHSVCGVQIAGFGANLVNGSVRGAQFGLVNLAAGRVDGAQFGMVQGGLGPVRGAQFGLVNWTNSSIDGAQFGLVGGGLGPLRGAQFGLVEFAGGGVTGAQFGLLNVGVGALEGLQAGLVNVSSREVLGAQLGLTNVSGATTHGLQMGLVNVSAERVRGAMIGLVNVAEDADAPIGLVNVLWDGRLHMDVWGTDFGLFALGIEHGSKRGGMHNLYGFGVTRRDGHAVFAPSYGIGARVAQTRHWFVDIDALGYWMFLRDDAQDEFDHAFIGTLRVPISYRFTQQIAVFVSPAVSVSVADVQDNSLADPSLVGGARLTQEDSDVLVKLWPGFTAGVRFF